MFSIYAVGCKLFLPPLHNPYSFFTNLPLLEMLHLAWLGLAGGPFHLNNLQ